MRATGRRGDEGPAGRGARTILSRVKHQRMILHTLDRSQKTHAIAHFQNASESPGPVCVMLTTLSATVEPLAARHGARLLDPLRHWEQDVRKLRRLCRVVGVLDNDEFGLGQGAPDLMQVGEACARQQRT